MADRAQVSRLGANVLLRDGLEKRRYAMVVEGRENLVTKARAWCGGALRFREANFSRTAGRNQTGPRSAQPGA